MSIRYVEAPEDYRPRPDDGLSVFLAGGITGCEDWQSRAVDLLDAALTDGVVFNPRRARFDVTDKDATPRQIEWEFTHLRRADVTLFWFPACDPALTVQPIALYELGAASADGSRRVAAGADRAYPRRLDVYWQLRLARPEVAVRSSLEETVRDVMRLVP